MLRAKKSTLIEFYKECTSKGYTDMTDETQALKAKVIASDMGLSIKNIDALFLNAKKEYEHSIIKGKKIFSINGDIDVYRREDGTVYSRGAINSESVRLYVQEGITVGYDYHPAKTVYTGATVGGVHTGGFHEEKAYVTERAHDSGKGTIYAAFEDKKIVVKKITIAYDIHDLFKRDKAYQLYVKSFVIYCYNDSNYAKETTSMMVNQLSNSQSYYQSEALLSTIANERHLPMQQCKEILGLINRIMNNKCPPSDEELYKKADALAAGNSVAELKKAIEMFENISDYKNSKARIRAVKKRLPEVEQYEKEQRILKQEKAAAEQKRRFKIAKKVVLIAIPVIIAIIITIHVVDELKWRTDVYNGAVSLAEAGDYENAISSFERLGSFRDSEQLAREAKNQRDYRYALSLFQNEKYEEAIAAFEKLDSYSDSAEKVLEIRCAYARSLSEEDRYDQALEQVKLAGDYKDSAAVMEEIKLNQYVYSIRVQLYNATHPTDDKITDAYKNIAALNKAIKDIEAHTKGMQLNECNAKFYENIKKVQPYLGNWKCPRPKDFVLTYYANSNLVVIEPIYDIIGDSFQLRMYGAKSAKSYNDREYHDFELDDIKMAGANKLTIEGVRYGYGRVFVR